MVFTEEHRALPLQQESAGKRLSTSTRSSGEDYLNDDDNFACVEGAPTVSTGVTTNPSFTEVNTESTYYILPSFHMHQSILNKSAFMCHPNYPACPLPSYYCGTSTTANPCMDVDDDLYQSSANESILNNFDKMEYIRDSLLEIKIYVARGPCVKGQKPPEQISLLKEYTSGEFLYGFYTVRNLSDKPHRFEQMTVALQGDFSYYNKTTGKTECTNFLRMIDLSGSFTFVDVPVDNSGGLVSPNEVDSFDGTMLCFGGLQTAYPNIVYKKFFRFKFPSQLLDESCDYYHNRHLELPPSIGVDHRLKNDLSVDPILGYGSSHKTGSPLLLHDFAPVGTSINYSVKVRIVSENTNKDSEVQYGILGKGDYFIRFVPTPSASIFGDALSTSKQVELLLNSLHNDYRDTQKRFELGLDLQDPFPDDVEGDVQTRKLEQLRISPSTESRNEKMGVSYSETIAVTGSSRALFKALKNIKKDDAHIGEVTVEVKSYPGQLDYRVPNMIRQHNKLAQPSKYIGKVRLLIVFKPVHTSVRPPNFKDVDVALRVTSVYSKGSIPISIDKEFARDTVNFINLRNEVVQITEKFKQFPPKTKILKSTLENLNSLNGISADNKEYHLLHKLNTTSSEWKLEQDSYSHIIWTKEVEVELEMNENRVAQLTLVPSFQSCHLSRFYNLIISTSFGSYGNATVSVPVEVVKNVD